MNWVLVIRVYREYRRLIASLTSLAPLQPIMDQQFYYGSTIFVVNKQCFYKGLLFYVNAQCSMHHSVKIWVQLQLMIWCQYCILNVLFTLLAPLQPIMDQQFYFNAECSMWSKYESNYNWCQWTWFPKDNLQAKCPNVSFILSYNESSYKLLFNSFLIFSWK
jgi:hypothetical protein